MKICPKCHRLSVEYDYARGEERCLYADCNYVNTEGIQLSTDYGEAAKVGIYPPYLKIKAFA